MFKLFLRYVIGGETGKRESALFILTLWIAFTVYILYREALGGVFIEGAFVPANIGAAQAMWMVVTPFTFAWVAAAFGFSWVSKQTTWGGSPSERDGD